MQKTVAILQSNYIPWKGYFDIINIVDEFILYDDVQYTRRDWRNRNLIKTIKGAQWLTIPVEVKGKYFQSIKDTKVSGSDWVNTHWKSLVHNYRRSQYFKEYEEFFQEIYKECIQLENLSSINFLFIKAINKILGINTKISWSMDHNLASGQTERLVELCKMVHATEYISGPAAKAYIIEDFFREANIKLSYMNYLDYPEYNQLYPEAGFIHGVTVLDLIFNEGPQAKNYMKSFIKKV